MSGCSSCGSRISYGCKSGLCIECYRGRNERHHQEIIEAFVSGQNFTQIGERFGCSRTTVYVIIGRHAPNIRKGLRHVQLADILAIVAEFYGVSETTLRSRLRTPRITRIRQIFYHVARNAGHSFPAIGKAINKDHSTAVHGYYKVLYRLDREPDLAKAVGRLSEIIETAKPNIAKRLEKLQVIAPAPKKVRHQPIKAKNDFRTDATIARSYSSMAHRNQAFLAALRAAYPERVAA